MDESCQNPEILPSSGREGDVAALRPSQWYEPPTRPFTRAQREHTTILTGGLTRAHDTLLAASFSHLGYRMEALPVPDKRAFETGKEFGDRGMCNPAYFTIGNLIRHLQRLRDENGRSAAELVEHTVFVTAGGAGPCRFGAYATQYRRALREAGFEGLRVLPFIQQGWLAPGRGEAAGIEFDFTFFLTFLRAVLAADVLNLQGYRIRPYETAPGATDRALEQSLAWVAQAFRAGQGVRAALLRAGEAFGSVPVDRSRPRPRVALIGEIWAMTTEGDGNYRMQRFLESEGAEVDVQPVLNWILYLNWQARFTTRKQLALWRASGGRAGLSPLRGAGRLAKLWLSEKAMRGIFHWYARAAGLTTYAPADLEAQAQAARPFYNLENEGGEAFMEVGKFLLAAHHRKAHVVVSVKPFGCLPSSGVSDGVQSAVTSRHPHVLFCPIETTGDAEANVASRVQMSLFTARRMAADEFEEALSRTGLDADQFREALAHRPWLSGALHHAPHVVAGETANLVYELGSQIPRRVTSRSPAQSRDRSIESPATTTR